MICGSPNVHQPGANGVNDQFGGLVNAERVHDVGAMNGYGVGAEVEIGSDFFVRFALDDHRQDLDLSRSERVAPLAFECRWLLELRIEDSFSGGYSPYGGA